MRRWRIRGFGNGPTTAPDDPAAVPGQRAVSSRTASSWDVTAAQVPGMPAEPQPQPSEAQSHEPSRPGSPFADAVRGAPPCPLRVRSALSCADVERVLSQLREVAVWAGNDGRVQDTGRFLLMDGERVWHSVAFGGAQGAALIARLRALPGFDTNLLLDAVSSRSGHLEPLWPPRVVASARR